MKRKEITVPFKDNELEYQRVLERAKYYFADYLELYKKECEKIAFYQYSIDSISMLRGFYCPSIILDLVISGIKRGKLLHGFPKHLLVPETETFRYGFNEKGQLLTTERMLNENREVLIHQDTMVMGAEFSEYIDGSGTEIEAYTECCYKDGKLESFITLTDPFESYGSSYSRESYFYNELGLDYVEVTEFEVRRRKASATRKEESFVLFLERGERYYFEHDAEGNLSEFRVARSTDGKFPEIDRADDEIKVKIRGKENAILPVSELPAKKINRAEERAVFARLRRNIEKQKIEDVFFFCGQPTVNDISPATAKISGAAMLRVAIFRRYKKIVKHLVELEVDLNYHEIDDIFEYGETPLIVAVEQGDLRMVKYLVEKGADVSITDRVGLRPYHRAMMLKAISIAKFLRKQENEELYNLNIRKKTLSNFKLSKDLEEFLQKKSPILCLEECAVESIEFFTLADTVEMNVQGEKVLGLTSRIGEFSEFILIWNPVKQCISYYDMLQK